MSQHSPDTKAAVLAALLTGQSVGSVADAYHLPQPTVSRWKREEYMRRHSDDPNAGEWKTKADVVNEKLEKLLEAGLETATTLLGLVCDRAWVHQQSAEGLAVLFGVTCDKVVRLLEARVPPDGEGMEPAAGPADESDQGGQ